MVRTIIQLTEEQATRLRQRATEDGVSVSALIRQSVDVLLQKPAISAEVRNRAMGAVGYVNSRDSDVSVRHDDYLAEAYGQ